VVKIAPRDATIFSEQDFAFAEDNAAFVTAILGRASANGSGDSFYDLGANGGPNARGWIEVEGAFLSARDPAATPAFRDTAGGVQAGADVDLSGGLRLGAAAGYEDEHLSDSLGGSGDATVARVSGYGSWTLGQIGLSAAVAYDYGWDNSARAAGFGVSTTSRRTDEISGALQASTSFTLADVLVAPSAGVILAHQDGGAFAETNSRSAAFAITGAPQGFDTAAPFAEVDVSHRYDAGGGLSLTPDASLGYRYDAAAGGEAFTLTAGDGTPFYGNRVGLDKSSAIAGASLTAHQGQWTFFLKYRADIAGNWDWQSVQGGLRMVF